MPSRTWTAARLSLALCLALLAGRAQAALTLSTPDGWSITFAGFVNGFVVAESGDVSPHVDIYGHTSKDSTIRIRTGFLPGLIGATIAAPEVQGIKAGARFGLYPNINGNPGQRTGITGNNMDFRELNFTLDGSFGQVLVGRALALFQGKNVLTDMSLFGVGVPSTIAFQNGPTLGHVGFGYLYPAFVSQVRYTSPDMSGFKIAAAIVDPANPAATGVDVTMGMPTLEAELSWAAKMGGTDLQAWLSGAYQSTKVAGSDVTSSGVAGGASAGFSGLELLASGFAGSGLGSAGVMQGDVPAALDGDNKARDSHAFLAQATYALGKVKLGANFSQLQLKATAADKAGGNAGLIDTRQAVTGGIYWDLIPSVKLVTEYSHAELKFLDASKAKSGTFSVGGFVFF